MVLVTGAAGKTGLAVIRALARRGLSVRGMVRKPGQITPVLEAGANEALAADFTQPGTLRHALEYARAIYHIAPNMHPQEMEIGSAMIAAARARRIEHFVFHSVLHPQTESMPHHWQKLRVEEMLFASGLPYTILQPCAYMQNIMPYLDQVGQSGIYAVPYSTSSRLSLIALEDLAEAAARIIDEAQHFSATYELCGPQALSAEQIAMSLSVPLNRPVTARQISPEEWKAGSPALHAYRSEALLKMFEYYDKHGLVGNPNTLRWLLEREPEGFAAFCERLKL